MQYQCRRQLSEALLNLVELPGGAAREPFRRLNFPLVLEIERDGSCQFRAFAVQLNMIDGGNRSPASMRAELVNYALQQIEREKCKATNDKTSLSYWLPAELKEDPEGWANKMRPLVSECACSTCYWLRLQRGEMGDDTTARIFAHKNKYTVDIYKLDTNSLNVQLYQCYDCGNKGVVSLLLHDHKVPLASLCCWLL